MGGEIQSLLERYDEAWNDQDLDTIVELHAPGMVFENHTAGSRAEGDEVRGHIGRIFENWPDMRFRRPQASGARRAGRERMDRVGDEAETARRSSGTASTSSSSKMA